MLAKITWWPMIITGLALGQFVIEIMKFKRMAPAMRDVQKDK